MKMSELKPCAACKGNINPNWYVIRISQAIINQRAVRDIMGLATMWGGIHRPGVLALAEAMAPEDEVGVILSDKDKTLMTELFICQNCFIKGPIDLAVLMQAARDMQEKATGEPEPAI